MGTEEGVEAGRRGEAAVASGRSGGERVCAVFAGRDVRTHGTQVDKWAARRAWKCARRNGSARARERAL